MEIIKKNGDSEEFLPNKISISISNCAAEVSTHLTESDLKYIIKKTTHILHCLNRQNTPTSSYEVKCIVYRVLRETGFKKIAQEYMNVR